MDVDTNIENYVISDLFDLLELDQETSTVNDVTDVVDQYIRGFEESTIITETRKDDIIIFFENIRDTLLFYIEHDQDDDENEFELLGQNAKDNDVIISEKDENREWDVDGDEAVLDDTKDHNTMRNKNVDVPSTRTENIFKGLLNPHIKNVVTRIVNVDSQFRQFVVDDEYKKSGNFTIDLSEPLTNVLSIRAYSAQIPFTWYVFDAENNTNFFFLDDVKISITSGNYVTLDELVEEINGALIENGIDDVTFSLIKASGKLKIHLGGKTITFFDTALVSDQKKNTTMGWIMGFRNKEYTEQDSITGEAVADLYGTKYVYIYLDEFSSNRVNNSIINLSDNQIKIRKHFNAIPRDLNMQRNPDGTIIVIPDDPRRNTKNQRFVMNRIFENQANEAAYEYASAPSTTNIFTMIPIKKNGFPVGEPIIEFGGSLQSGERVYFGPVNINKFRVKLLDDMGRVINLNGNDWSFSFLCETLYQRANVEQNDGKN